MGRKLIDMSELEYGVVSTVVVTAVVHYTRLARVAREGACRFRQWDFAVSHLYFGTDFRLKAFIYLTVNFSRWHGSTYTTVLSSKARKLILSSGSVCTILKMCQPITLSERVLILRENVLKRVPVLNVKAY